MQTFQSIELLGEALLRRGYTHSRVRLDGRNCHRFEKGERAWTTQPGNPLYPFVAPRIRTLSRQKNLANAYVQSRGFTVPNTHLLPYNNVPTHLVLPRLRSPLIVKPVDGAGSRNVTRSVTTKAELLRGVKKVHDSNTDALVQEQFIGQELRLTVLNGSVVSVLIRDTPRLVGDGKRSLAQLLTDENIARASIRVPYLTYPQLTDELIHLPADQEYVPSKGQIISLGHSAMISGGASVYNIDDTVHDSYKKLALAMVADLNAPFLVIDLLVKDYTQAATADSYVFLEFNTAPALKLYYSFRDGKHFDIIPMLVNMIEASAR